MNENKQNFTQSEAEGKKLIPELRFPEFKNSGEWVVKKLGECIIEKNIKTTENNQYPILTSSKNGIILQNEYFNKQTASINNIGYKIVDFGDFTYRSMSDTGNFTFNIQYLIPRGIVSPAYPVFQVIKKKIVSNFLYYYLNYSYSIKKQIYKLKQGGTRFALHFKKLSLFQILLPTLAEQQKIAAFFSNLDELIDAHKQKLELLKQHKKGLMQNLFPQEGEKVPKFRFPEFKNDEEWVEKKLGEVGEFVGGGTPSTSKSEYWNGSIQWYTPTEVKNRFLKHSIRTITKEGLKNSSAKLLPKGTLLITTRATIGDVGIANEECTTNQGFQNLIVNDENDNIFWFYWIFNNQGELEKRAHGSTFKEISKNEIKNIPVLKPSIPEQQKIASFLSNLDELIAAQAEKTEQLERHKKGLMQRVFPVV